MAIGVPSRTVHAMGYKIEIVPAQLHGVLWRRIAAYCVDLVVIFLIGVAAALLFIPAAILSFGLLASPLSIVFGLIPIGYHTLLIGGPYGATLGQLMFDLRVIDVAEGGRPSYIQAFVQSALFYFTVALTSFLVLFFVFFNPQRRTLHDWLSGTLVVRRSVWDSGVVLISPPPPRPR